MANNLAERRLVIRVNHVWQRAAGPFCPRRSQIDPTEFGADWTHCFMIDLDDVVAYSRFSYVGSALRDLTWPTFERQRVSECLDDSLLELAVRQIPKIVKSKQALHFAGPAFHQEAHILYRTILLPLSENGKHLDGLLGAVGYREVPTDGIFSADEIGLTGKDHSVGSSI